jgi:hypothetical protein
VISKHVSISIIAGAVLLAVSSPAHAYIGPGGAASAIGTVLALLAAFIMAVFGFLWFPIRRLLRRRRQARMSESASPDVPETAPQEADEQ